MPLCHLRSVDADSSVFRVRELFATPTPSMSYLPRSRNCRVSIVASVMRLVGAALERRVPRTEERRVVLAALLLSWASVTSQRLVGVAQLGASYT